MGNLVKELRIRVGLRWIDAKGREWEVFEILGFGRVRIRTTDLRFQCDTTNDSIRTELSANK